MKKEQRRKLDRAISAVIYKLSPGWSTDRVNQLVFYGRPAIPSEHNKNWMWNHYATLDDAYGAIPEFTRKAKAQEQLTRFMLSKGYHIETRRTKENNLVVLRRDQMVWSEEHKKYGVALVQVILKTVGGEDG